MAGSRGADTSDWILIGLGGQGHAEVSFGAEVTDVLGHTTIDWQILHEQNRGAMLNRGPIGEVCH